MHLGMKYYRNKTERYIISFGWRIWEEQPRGDTETLKTDMIRGKVCVEGVDIIWHFLDP